MPSERYLPEWAQRLPGLSDTVPVSLLSFPVRIGFSLRLPCQSGCALNWRRDAEQGDRLKGNPGP